MLGPVRGSWPDYEWKGWWGENPPFHTPVFVLRHHARVPLSMARKTEFHFVTGAVDAALHRAAEAQTVRTLASAASLRRCWCWDGKVMKQLFKEKTSLPVWWKEAGCTRLTHLSSGTRR